MRMPYMKHNLVLTTLNIALSICFAVFNDLHRWTILIRLGDSLCFSVCCCSASRQSFSTWTRSSRNTWKTNLDWIGETSSTLEFTVVSASSAHQHTGMSTIRSRWFVPKLGGILTSNSPPFSTPISPFPFFPFLSLFPLLDTFSPKTS